MVIANNQFTKTGIHKCSKYCLCLINIDSVYASVSTLRLFPTNNLKILIFWNFGWIAISLQQ